MYDGNQDPKSEQPEACLSTDLAADFLEGKLDEAAQQRVEEHIDTCSTCRQLLAHAARSSKLDDQIRSGTLADMMRPTQGSKLGRYTTKTSLGAGGMGVVTLAWDSELKRHVALKLVRPDLADPSDTQGARQRVLREAQAMAQLSDPHVVAIYDVGTHEGDVFIAMEYVDGSSLDVWLKEKPRSWREIIRVFVAAGQGLIAAHRRHIVHRDFKPHNVLISRAGLVKVTDFGLARIFEEGRHRRSSTPENRSRALGSATDWLQSELTKTGAAMGTPAYMSPEQLRMQPVSARSDQYSFCVALHEALYGNRPFSGMTEEALLKSIHEQQYAAPKNKRRIPRHIERAVRRGLCADPQKRFASMEVLVWALQSPSYARFVAVGLAAAALLAFMVVLFLRVGSPQLLGSPLCKAMSVPSPWTAEQQQRTRTAFDKTRLPYASAVWLKLRAEVAQREKTASVNQKRICEGVAAPTHDSELTRAQVRCMQTRQAQYRSFLSGLEKPTPKILLSAVHVLRQLQPDFACIIPGRAGADDPKTYRMRSLLSIKLQGAEQAAAQFDLKTARTVVEAVMKDATQLNDTRILAGAELVLGQIGVLEGHPAQALEHVHRASMNADVAQDDTLRARAYLELVRMTYKAGRFEEAIRWSRYAQAVIQRSGNLPDLETQWSVLWGNLQQSQGSSREALQARHNALTLSIRNYGDPSVDVAHARFKLAQSLLDIPGQVRAATAELKQVVAIYKAYYGEGQVEVADALQTWARALSAQGRYTEARDMLQQALDSFERASEKHPIEISMCLSDLAETYDHLGDKAKAYELMHASLAGIEAALGVDHPTVATRLLLLAHMYLADQRLAEAFASARRALLIRELAEGRDHPATIPYRILVAGVHMELKQFSEAEVQLRHALTIGGTMFKASSPQLRTAQYGLAQLLIKRKAFAEARGILEKMLAHPPEPENPTEHARVNFALAKALEGTRQDPARVRQLAGEAKMFYSQTHKPEKAAEIDAWLSRH